MNGKYSDFCEKVCSIVDTATARERREIHKELSDHLEDHAAALMDLGRGEEEAHAAAVAAMGDPEEIGREMNKLYPKAWLIVRRIAVALCIVLCISLLSSISDTVSTAVNSYRIRTEPWSFLGEEYENTPDIRISLPINGDVFHVYGCDIAQSGEQYMARVGMVTYAENPFNRVSVKANDLHFIWNGEEVTPSGGGSFGHAYSNFDMDIPIEYGQESITAVYDRYGQYLSFEIPLDWEVAE